MKVLTIDRDREVQQWLQIFADQNGWEHRAASDGEQALKVRQSYEPDLILLDYLVLGVFGPDYLGALQQHEEIPVILLIDRVFMGRPHRFQLSGACDFLFKPIQAAELKLRIDKVFGDIESESSFIEYGPVRIDLRLKQVAIAGKRIDLSPKEYQILKLLVHEHGRVTTSQEILDKVWKGSSRASTGDVQQYIYLLRNRLKKKIGPHDCVHNDKGFGYRLYCMECPNPCSNIVYLQQKKARQAESATESVFYHGA